ncbi:hypothetical protein SGPA1_30983 [Streptomyces misionensis JCM 4497]
MDGQRRPSRGRVVEADDPRRDLGLLVHRVGHVVGASVLGELRRLPGQGDRAIRAVGLPARHHPPVEAGGRASVHRPALVRGVAARRPLRRAGAAGVAGRAGARILPPVPLTVRATRPDSSAATRGVASEAASQGEPCRFPGASPATRTLSGAPVSAPRPHCSSTPSWLSVGSRTFS